MSKMKSSNINGTTSAIGGCKMTKLVDYFVIAGYDNEQDS
jgi:hypothetical protein